MSTNHLLEKYKISFINKCTSFNSDKVNTKIAVHEVSDDYWGYFLTISHRFQI
jgi:hypothetical protein